MKSTKPTQPTVMISVWLAIAPIVALAHESYDFRKTVWHTQFTRSKQNENAGQRIVSYGVAFLFSAYKVSQINTRRL